MIFYFSNSRSFYAHCTEKVYYFVYPDTFLHSPVFYTLFSSSAGSYSVVMAAALPRPPRQSLHDVVVARRKSLAKAQRMEAEDMMFGFSQLSLYNPATNKLVLNDLSGYVPRGGITAVLGSSSSGKTVLLKALAGRLDELQLQPAGQAVITFDNRRLELHHRGSGSDGRAFVPQDDNALIGVLTPREALTYSAKLKQPGHSNHKELVKLTLERTGLTDVADNLIGTFYRRGLSGGQKRRCSVALELLSNPRMLFLDEPTSGLDHPRALSVIASLRDLVQNAEGAGMGIMLSIHQPSSDILSYFDNVLLLSEGSAIFFGSVQDATSYFSSLGYPVPAATTPTDHFLLLADAKANRLLDSSVQDSQSSAAGDDLQLAAHFAVSNYAKAVKALVDTSAQKASSRGPQKKSCVVPTPKPAAADSWTQLGSPWLNVLKQYLQLLSRFYLIARRDLSLFYFQVLLQLIYGFLVGAVG